MKQRQEGLWYLTEETRERMSKSKMGKATPWNEGKQERIPCPHCGRLIGYKQLKKHESYCDAKVSE